MWQLFRTVHANWRIVWVLGVSFFLFTFGAVENELNYLGQVLQEELEKQMQDLLGEKTAADDEKLDRKKKEKNPRVEVTILS